MRISKHFISVSTISLFISLLNVFLILCDDITEKSVLSEITNTRRAVEDLKLILGCSDKSFKLEKIEDESFWIFKNYIRAEHGEMNCAESMTYATHGDLTVLDNLEELLARWEAPVSFAIYTPESYFNKTLESIQYVRNCFKESYIIQYYVTFHIYFPKDQIPSSIPLTENDAVNWPYDCTLPPPYEKINQRSHNLKYPINMGRKIARNAALTYFILESDIGLHPNPGFVDEFLKMVKRNSSRSGERPMGFPLAAFAIDKDSIMPETKMELQELINNKAASLVYKKVCGLCQHTLNMAYCMAVNEMDHLNSFLVGQRRTFLESFYVGDNREPNFDEQVTWEGQKSKYFQGLATMCLLDYEYYVLNNAFLMHSPGAKVYKRNLNREQNVIRRKFVPKFEIFYGNRKYCFP